MKRLSIKITGASGQSFDVALTLTGWFDFEGEWKSLPGFLPKTSGYFWLNDKYNYVTFFDREKGFFEEVAWAYGSDEQTVRYLSLDDFTPSVTKGSNGTGNIYKNGSKTDPFLKKPNGFVSHDIKWEVTDAF